MRSFWWDVHSALLLRGRGQEVAPVISGKPQGTVFGPLLFLIQISDIDHGLLNGVARSFADDTRIMMAIKAAEDTSKLQEDLGRVYDWAAQNNMFFNGAKFQHMRYGGVPDDMPRYRAQDGTAIGTRRSLTDLGVIMEGRARYDEQITQIALKGK